MYLLLWLLLRKLIYKLLFDDFVLLSTLNQRSVMLKSFAVEIERLSFKWLRILAAFSASADTGTNFNR